MKYHEIVNGPNREQISHLIGLYGKEFYNGVYMSIRKGYLDETENEPNNNMKIFLKDRYSFGVRIINRYI